MPRTANTRRLVLSPSPATSAAAAALPLVTLHERTSDPIPQVIRLFIPRSQSTATQLPPLAARIPNNPPTPLDNPCRLPARSFGRWFHAHSKLSGGAPHGTNECLPVGGDDGDDDYCRATCFEIHLYIL